MEEFHKRHNRCVQPDFPEKASYLTYDIGSFLMQYFQEQGYKYADIDEQTVTHLTGISWHGEEINRAVIQSGEYRMAINEAEVKAREKLPELFKIYFDMFGDYKFES